MVQTRKGATTDPSPSEGQAQDRGSMDRRQEDPLEDTASHVPLVSLQQSIGGSVRLQAEEGPRQVNALPPEGLGQ